MTPAFGHAMLEHWMLDPAVLYLNHGTVGATPRRVLARQQEFRDQMERQPARFMLRELADVKQIPMRMEPRLRTAAREVAAFLGAREADLVFVDNATSGVNAVLRSLRFEPGDEILLTDHGYGAIERVARHVAERAGAVVRTVALPGTGATAAAISQAIGDALAPRTRLAIVDHVTSGSALVLPIADIAARCRAAGVPLLVDGAHAPGALPLDIPAIGADWYTGNLHKWAMAPRGCGVLWAPPARQAALHPSVISWGYELGLAAEFDWPGTRDPSAFLAAPEGIAFLRDLGLDAVRAHNHALAWDAARFLADRWGVPPPADESLVGCMVTVPMPARFGADSESVQRLKDALLYDDGIEVQMHAGSGRGWLRLSAQVYVERGDVERLAKALEARA